MNTSLLPPERALLCYTEAENGTRRYKYIRRYNPSLCCHEFTRFDSNGYVAYIARAFPGKGWEIDWKDCDPSGLREGADEWAGIE